MQTSAEQLAFNAAVLGLRAQGKLSLSHDGQSCMYRNDDGCKCAVGFLIPNRNYVKSIENTTASAPSITTRLSKKYKDVPAQFLRDMQYAIHDSLVDAGGSRFDSKEFEKRVREFAKDNNLEVPPHA
jgi:hypothetical protein